MLQEKQFRTPKKRLASIRERRVKLYSLGLCIQCSKPNDRLPLQRCSICDKKFKSYTKSIRANLTKSHQKWRWLLKLEAMKKITGKNAPDCCICGITDIRLLTINHLNGNTKSEKEKYRKRLWHFYKDIVDGGRDVKDLDVRCFNHNILYDYERGARIIPC